MLSEDFEKAVLFVSRMDSLAKRMDDQGLVTFDEYCAMDYAQRKEIEEACVLWDTNENRLILQVVDVPDHSIDIMCYMDEDPEYRFMRIVPREEDDYSRWLEVWIDELGLVFVVDENGWYRVQ